MSEEKKSVYFFWQIFGLTGILHCHFIWFRVPWDSQVGGQNVKLKTVQQPGISHWHWKWIWFMSIFKNILLAVILLSWDRVHYGDNILSKHHPLLCLRYKCQHIWKDMLLLFKRDRLQLKAISSYFLRMVQFSQKITKKFLVLHFFSSNQAYQAFASFFNTS